MYDILSVWYQYKPIAYRNAVVADLPVRKVLNQEKS